ncbi:BhlA/UviB family holin-like peptide [Priestia megaterium]|uniref:BhlA/UviB family holin-like peptide n=1 Tax=Priestia megaterium TaxID=1404 RepID=UPI0023DB92F5|nr:BhlA/UviB family holin-like peptide [Priestia megaterium]MDF2010187.1 BhlA/UviB family holin-like peptide [Priestia megaterium]
MEQILLNFGLKDGLFAGLFVWLLLHQMRTSQKREDKLYNFLDDMKIEFAKLVGSYEKLSTDVNDIRQQLNEQINKKSNEK